LLGSLIIRAPACYIYWSAELLRFCKVPAIADRRL